ncbi:hypothetical protein NC652_019951 [Populus alba x Populus x berolinensis]|nr:hypothetical protein NC652_019951 [Populus alba x Populus x berolinensis]
MIFTSRSPTRFVVLQAPLTSLNMEEVNLVVLIVHSLVANRDQRNTDPSYEFSSQVPVGIMNILIVVNCINAGSSEACGSLMLTSEAILRNS